MTPGSVPEQPSQPSTPGSTTEDAITPGDATTPAAASEAPAVDDWPWSALDRRTLPASLIMFALVLTATAVPVGIGLALSSVSWGWIAFWLVGGVVVGTGLATVAEAVRIKITSYRVSDARIERRLELIGSSRTSIARERIRNVEISADIVQRRFGVADVRLGTGEHKGPDFTLRSLDRGLAEDLRVQLLGREGRDQHESGDGTQRIGILATLDRAWIRYAPVSFLTPVLGLAAFGVVLQVADWFQAVPRLWDWVVELVAAVSLLGLVGLVLVIVLVIGTIASIAVWVESWWDYKLEREQSGSLHVSRGLITKRSTTFEGERIRGMALVEPPGIRRMGAGRLDIIAVGLNTQSEGDQNKRQSPTVLPPAPLSVAHELGEAILGTPMINTITTHPPEARRRRLFRAVVVSLVLTLLVLVLTLMIMPAWWWLALIMLVVAGPVSFLIAVDNARGLGHHLGADFVAIRRGSVFRRTEVLERRGLLSWNVRQTPFQRRAGLVTLVATSAAGSGSFRLPDVGVAQVADLVATAGPVWQQLQAAPESADLRE